MEILNKVMENWETITASSLIILASLDKVLLIAIKGIGNVRDAWKESFPKKKR